MPRGSTTVHGRQNRLRDVARRSVSLPWLVGAGASGPPPSRGVRASSGWAYFDDRQNYLRDVAGEPLNPPRPLAH